VTDGFDVVAVGIADERAVVVGVVPGVAPCDSFTSRLHPKFVVKREKFEQ
jgi:hypothetical protein